MFVLNSKHTDRQWHCDHELMGAGSGTTSAHHGGWRRMSSNITTETQREWEIERRVGHNSPWCKVQDLSFLPAVLFHLRLTLAAAQSNMPLCWRGRVKGTCFFFFFLAKALSCDVELSWRGLLRYPQWCKWFSNDREKENLCESWAAVAFWALV